MSNLLNKIKKWVPLSVKSVLKMSFRYCLGRWKLKRVYESSNRKIVLVGTSFHGNLGDQAIGYAELEFFDKYCDVQASEVIEIPFNALVDHLACMKKYLTSDDVIAIHGGGNMGDEYQCCEDQRRLIIKKFKRLPIVVFPQTVFFSDSESGRQQLAISKEIYGSHNNLLLLAREEKSYGFMSKEFSSNSVKFTPDIVMTLAKKGQKGKRENVYICLRSDVESSLSDKQRVSIVETVKRYSADPHFTDTYAYDDFELSMREELLKMKWDEFRKAKLIITDRIHGMVFAAMTETPCIALGNYNHKVKSSYQWYHHLPYIRFIDKLDKLEDEIVSLLSIPESRCEYDNTFSERYFTEVISIINGSKPPR